MGRKGMKRPHGMDLGLRTVETRATIILYACDDGVIENSLRDVVELCRKLVAQFSPASLTTEQPKLAMGE